MDAIIQIENMPTVARPMAMVGTIQWMELADVQPNMKRPMGMSAL